MVLVLLQFSENIYSGLRHENLLMITPCNSENNVKIQIKYLGKQARK